MVGCEAGERLRLAAPVGHTVALRELPSKLVELVGRCRSRCAHIIWIIAIPEKWANIFNEGRRGENSHKLG